MRDPNNSTPDHGPTEPVGNAPGPAGATTSKPPRLAVLDAQRGLIMIVMALDHASYFIAMRHYSEYWGFALPVYPGGLALFTRVISHLCAPGFFFLMGVGMHMFWSSRRARGWTEGRIRRHFLTRGSVLIVMEIFIIAPAFILGMWEQISAAGGPSDPIPGAGGDPFILLGVLAALGASMIMASFLLRLGAVATVALGVAILVGCHFIVPDASRVGEAMSLLERLFLVAGHDQFLINNYPFLPWFPVCLFGIAYGHWLKADANAALKGTLVAGLVGAVAFVLLRGAGGFGTHHPVVGDEWTAYLHVTKYPPSIAFLLLSLSVNALFMSMIYRAQRGLEGMGRMLLVFGRAPLFFYVVHLYLYGIVGFLHPGSTSLIAMYPVWILGLVALYPACKWYNGFKGSKSEDSLWRLF